jgi:hypothetical protein
MPPRAIREGCGRGRHVTVKLISGYQYAMDDARALMQPQYCKMYRCIWMVAVRNMNQESVITARLFLNSLHVKFARNRRFYSYRNKCNALLWTEIMCAKNRNYWFHTSRLKIVAPIFVALYFLTDSLHRHTSKLFRVRMFTTMKCYSSQYLKTCHEMLWIPEVSHMRFLSI